MIENNPNRRAVYTIIESESEGRKSRWIRVGIAFVNRDGSLNVLLDALPVNGKLHIRDFPPEGETNVGSTPSVAEPPAPARRNQAAKAAA